MYMKERIAAQLPAWRERVHRLVKEHGDYKVCDVTIEQISAGIRGVMINISDISYVDPTQGIRLRGFGQDIIQMLGGDKVHPDWAVPGGVAACWVGLGLIGAG